MSEPGRDEREAPLTRFDVYPWLNETIKASGWNVGRLIQLVEAKGHLEDLADTILAWQASRASAALPQTAQMTLNQAKQYLREYGVLLANQPNDESSRNADKNWIIYGDEFVNALLRISASLPQPSAGQHEPIRFNLGTCDGDNNRPHLENDNHICHSWIKSPSAGQTEGK